jgi:sugar lactone lactonase YvrE
MTKMVEKYENTRAWSERISWTGINCPGAMALYTDPGGNVFIVVCEVSTHSIMVFNKNTTMSVRSWGGQGTDTGQFNTPLGVSVSKQGIIGVCDSHNHRVQFFEMDGKVVSEYHNNIYYPVSIAFNYNGDTVITDLQNRIQVRNKEGQIIRLIGSSGSGSGIGPGVLSRPMGLATTMKGNIFVCDTQNNRIQVFSQYGKVMCIFGADKLTSPFAISVLPTGEIYVTDMKGTFNGFRIFLVEKEKSFFGVCVLHFLQKKEGQKIGGMAVSDNGDIIFSIHKKSKMVMYKNYNINKFGDLDKELLFTEYKDSVTNRVLDGNIVLKLWLP